MVDAHFSALLPAKILLPALKPLACTENGATTAPVVLLVLRLANRFLRCAVSAISFTSLRVKLALENLLIAPPATLNAARSTAWLVSGVLTGIMPLHAVFKSAHKFARSPPIQVVVEPSVHHLCDMTPRLLAVLLIVLWTNGAHGLSAHRVFQMAKLPNNKSEAEESLFKLAAVAETAQQTLPNPVNAPPLLAIEAVKLPLGALGVPAMLAVVMVIKPNTAASV